MTNDVENLVLEQLRLIRSETASLRSEFHQRFDMVNTRLESLEHAVSGIAYVLVETRGELLRQAERIERLERAGT